MPFGRELIFAPARGCKYISGDPKTGGWSYCGEKLVEPSSSWCAEHHAVVYGLPKPKPAPKPEPAPETKREAAPAQVGLEDPLLMS